MAFLGPLMLGMFVLSAVGGTISGGINAANQQAEINQQICNIAAQMKQYKSLILSEDQLYAAATGEIQAQVYSLAAQISLLQNAIRDQHSKFKETYNRWVMSGFIFLIILIFIFATKKFILGASTELKS
jgi:hypothetical protein